MEKVVPRFGIGGNGVIFFFVTLAIALVTWWLFGDPKWGIVDAYPFPFLFVAVWVILSVVWFAFNFEMSLFTWVPDRQPLKGIVVTAFAALLIYVVYLILNVGWGAVNPNLSPTSPTGYVLSAFIVLIGFFIWVMVCLGFGHWPFSDAGLKQPLLGFAEWLLGFALMIVFYFALVYPALVHSKHALLDFFTMTGWWYSCVVGIIMVCVLWGNWPITKISENRAIRGIGTALFAFIVGTIWYFIAVGLLKAGLVPQDIQAEMAKVSPTLINYYTAELGVCFNAAALFLFVFFANWPTKFSNLVNIIIRTIICIAAGIIIFLIFMNGFGVAVLHEKAPTLVVGNWGGDPLNFIDWWIGIYLVVGIYFGCWPLMKKVEE